MGAAASLHIISLQHFRNVGVELLAATDFIKAFE